MAIKVFTYSLDTLWSDSAQRLALAAMPLAVRERISAYKDIKDQQARLAGRLLLARMLRAFQIPFSLADIRFSTTHKPYLDGSFDFSISHTEGTVVCAGTTTGLIGIDVEQIRPIDLRDFSDSLIERERQSIFKQVPGLSFWDIWTRKEAIAKASGRGIQMHWTDIDVCENIVHLQGHTYGLQKLDLGANIAAHLAVSEVIPREEQNIEIVQVDTPALMATH